MSEEVKDAESTPEETPEKTEAPVEGTADGVEAPTEQAAAAKVKKINNLSKEALTKKIAEYEDKGQVRSKYYQHLKRRQSELGA